MATDTTLDLELLKAPLTPAETPGLDTLDPRFQEIAGLVEGGEAGKAAAAVEALIRENICDIRVIGYYLFGAFCERGLGGLDDVLQACMALFGDNWAAFGPVKKKEMHAEKGLAWFFQRLEKKLAYEEQQKQDEWNKWTSEVGGDAVKGFMARLDEVKTASAAKMPTAPKMVEAMQKVSDWLRSFEKLVHVDAPPPEPEPKPAAEEKPAEEAPKAKAGGKGAPAAAAAPAQGEAVLFNRPMMEGSHHLQDLLDRLAAFEQLLKKKNFDKASLAALAIQDAIEHFDPRLYFPKLFAGYYKLMAEHVEALAPLWESKESLPWKAREQLFKVDLDAFVGGGK